MQGEKSTLASDGELGRKETMTSVIMLSMVATKLIPTWEAAG